jgi:hypothetical protein
MADANGDSSSRVSVARRRGRSRRGRSRPERMRRVGILLWSVDAQLKQCARPESGKPKEKRRLSIHGNPALPSLGSQLNV